MTDWVLAALRGLLGMAGLLAVTWALSRNRRAIDWKLVGGGVLLQVGVAVLTLRVDAVRRAVDAVSGFFVGVLGFTRQGSEFLFGPLVTDTESFGYIFAVQVLPTIVFFAALTSVLYYLNILQRVVYGCAWVMNRTMRLSGAESLAAAANIFVGQTEAPLVVKPYIDGMTRSEMLALMTGGMATIAGAVLAAYVGLLGGDDPAQQQYFATHLLVASLISAPAGLVAAKMMIPETEPVAQDLMFPRDRMGGNLLDALTQGTTEGIKLAVNVGAMLLVFTAFIAMANFVLTHWIGGWTGLNAAIAEASGGRYPGLTLQFLFGAGFAPVAWLIGVPTGDLMAVGQLLGEKTILNEFYAYTTLADMRSGAFLHHPRSTIIATYALCGFANFASVGIQIGGIGVLAPRRRLLLSQLGLQALVAGTLACLMTACVAGAVAD